MTDSGQRTPETLVRVTLVLCSRCIAGEGGECHTPGCALWMKSAPDVPIADYCESFQVIANDPGATGTDGCRTCHRPWTECEC